MGTQNFCLSHDSNELQMLNHNIRRFWEIESVDENHVESNEVNLCEEHFSKTHYRNEEGRYVVQLPVKHDKVLGECSEIPTKRLDALWRRLEKNDEMKVLYTNFISEYISLGHMEKVGPFSNNSTGYFLPHHGIHKPENSSTRLRVVFDASVVSSSGESLNSMLMNGGVVQDNLFSIMLRFRKHKYAFTADIIKMYRQILIEPNQANLQRILWKDDVNKNVNIYKLKTVTYGTACAPYLATRVLKQLAMNERLNYPLASAATQNDFYVDDILTGSDELSTACELKRQLIEMLQTSGMQLHKWAANNYRFLDQTQVNQPEFEYQFEDTMNNTPVKTLGLIWNPSADEFAFKVTLEIPSSCTKRSVLSDISKIFDPLGLIGPVIAKAKIFMQKLWLLNLDWNEDLPEKETKDWIRFVTELNCITSLRVQRRVISDRTIKFELHGFADASGSAYGALLYLKCVIDSNQFSSHLLCSKSRVAPIKSITIPRLELNAAVLLSQLTSQVLKALQMDINKVYLWSDSTVTLAWINTSPHLLKTFVANRVSTIQTLTAEYTWGHIRSELNPADLISRGLHPVKILDNDMWWNGPPQLMREHVSQEPIDFTSDEDAFSREIKQKPEKALITTTKESWIENVIQRSSNYLKIIRIVAYVLRFCYNMKNVKQKKEGPICKEEMNDARTKIINRIQSEEFKEDITNLRRNNNVHVKSKLKTLYPFLDSDGLLRVGGRLTNAHVAYEKKHQVVLPAKHKLTKLIFEHYHLKNLHVGAQTLLYTVRQSFWPINGRCLARKVVHECITCFRAQPTSVVQLIWKRWQLDYLNNLQQRSKWYFAKENVSKDTLVLVKEDNLPTCKWLLGRIEEVVYGSDGKVRVVVVNTKKGKIKRCVSKICILPTKDSFDVG